jgi:uncharacterized protein YyaL (SSP411 family)
MESIYDPDNGGFGSAPKFPTSHNLLFLLRYWKRRNEDRALEMVEETLHAMRLGGVYDHIGFGFHRYSTDSGWLLPHFEKMLYDQAMQALAYLEAYQATGNVDFAKTAREIFSYVLRDLTSSEGGFYTAEDADSQGEEGRFYLWREEDIREILGKDEGDFIEEIFSICKDGNFKEEATGRKTGTNILYMQKTPEILANEKGITRGELAEKIENARKKLFGNRNKRVHPDLDDKILVDMNGLMIAALARGARVLGEPKYLEAAERAVAFILAIMRGLDGRLLHRFRDGQAAITANLDDYAFLVWGVLELYESTFNVKYLLTALDLDRDMLEHFWDREHGGFFFTADDAEDLPFRQKLVYDGAIPSGNSVALDNLLRLGRITGDQKFEDKAWQMIQAFATKVNDIPSAHTHFISSLGYALGPRYDVVVAGPHSDDTRNMLDTLARHYLPDAVIIYRPIGKDQGLIEELAEYTREHVSIDGKPTAYVCRNNECSKPTTNVVSMLDLLGVKTDRR